jgi:hypothetical protein
MGISDSYWLDSHLLVLTWYVGDNFQDSTLFVFFELEFPFLSRKRISVTGYIRNYSSETRRTLLT